MFVDEPFSRKVTSVTVTKPPLSTMVVIWMKETVPLMVVVLMAPRIKNLPPHEDRELTNASTSNTDRRRFTTHLHTGELCRKSTPVLGAGRWEAASQISRPKRPPSVPVEIAHRAPSP